MWVENGRSVEKDKVAQPETLALKATPAHTETLMDEGYLWMVNRAEKRESK
jgi:hypothetical protein